MHLSTLLKNWRSTAAIAQNISAWRTFPSRQAHTVPLPANLHSVLLQVLHEQRINALYTHQAAAWNKIQAGQHPVIVTGTASGKTLCYNLPVLHHLLTNPHSRALYLFPTKALAHDQLAIINEQLAIINEQLANSQSAIGNSQSPIQNSKFKIQNLTPPFTASTYDGDTPPSLRPSVRGKAQIILSNPDMLHTAILPHHTKWAEFFQHLRFVVIDEMHVYRGVFGSHVANTLRRLKRVANFYGAAPQFILTSATIANPLELAGRLIEEPVTLINEDGAARGAKHFLIYNPPIVNAELGVRRSALQESVRLGRELIEAGAQTIIFGRTRRTVELLLSYLRETVPQSPQLTADAPSPTIRAYRSGYLPRQRREIERGLREGAVQAVVATSALELGIDIGKLSAAVLVGYPGTIAGTWQQVGRAGRQSEEAMAVLITSANPLDQFLAHHPDYFFERSPEQALINPDNLLILLQHLRCAAFELPFQVGDTFGRVGTEQVAEFLEVLRDSGEVHQSGQKYFWMAEHYPAANVSLRSASPASVRLQVEDDDGTQHTIGLVDAASALWMVHPEAIYLHEGQSFVVEELNLDELIARLQPSRADHYTEPKRDTSVQLIKQLNQTQIKGGSKHHGEILVTTQIIGYRMVQWFSQEHLGDGEVDLPPQELHTTGYWLALAPATVENLREQGLWSNDPNNYGPNWAARRNQVRARDGYRCQMCGAPEQDREHDVHHKIPFRRFDSYQQANQPDNLVTLCRSCHRRAETAVKMRSGLTGLATVLGHLAPLFLMCDTYDIGLHADPQSPLAEGQPAVIIYDAIPAGIGFSDRLFEDHDTLIRHAHDLVSGCSCADGCPSCVGPAGEEGVGGKRETLALLSALS